MSWTLITGISLAIIDLPSSNAGWFGGSAALGSATFCIHVDRELVEGPRHSKFHSPQLPESSE